MKVYRFFEKDLALVLLCLCSRTSVLARKAVRLRAIVTVVLSYLYRSRSWFQKWVAGTSPHEEAQSALTTALCFLASVGDLFRAADRVELVFGSQQQAIAGERW